MGVGSGHTQAYWDGAARSEGLAPVARAGGAVSDVSCLAWSPPVVQLPSPPQPPGAPLPGCRPARVALPLRDVRPLTCACCQVQLTTDLVLNGDFLEHYQAYLTQLVRGAGRAGGACERAAAAAAAGPRSRCSVGCVLCGACCKVQPGVLSCAFVLLCFLRPGSRRSGPAQAPSYDRGDKIAVRTSQLLQLKLLIKCVLVPPRRWDTSSWRTLWPAQQARQAQRGLAGTWTLWRRCGARSGPLRVYPRACEPTW